VGIHIDSWGDPVTASVTDVITGLTKCECPGWKIINDDLAWDIFSTALRLDKFDISLKHPSIIRFFADMDSQVHEPPAEPMVIESGLYS